TGLILAVAASAGFLAPDVLRGGLPDEWLIGVPVMVGLTAVVGGLAGRLMVPPAPRLPTFGRLDSHVVVRVERKQPPTAWVQAVGGATLAVAGTAKAEAVRQALGTALLSGG